MEKSHAIVICAHVGPDGDAIGSALAVRHWLERKGKLAEIVVPTPFPDFLMWLPGAPSIHVYSRREEVLQPLMARADLFLIVDLNAPERMGDLASVVTSSPVPKVMIDHHLHPTDFCDICISHPGMCATGEVLCHLLEQIGDLETISKEEATCLYTAMMCDTGAFTYASNRPVVYECISRLLMRGIDKDRIYRNVFWTSSPARMRLQGYMLYVKMEVLAERHASIMTLTNEERRMLGIKNGDTEGLVNLPLQMAGMRLSIFLSEDTEHEGMVKVSLRSVDDFPCNRMAGEFFAGGGHRNASGGRLACTMEEAISRTHDAISAYADMLK